MATLGEIATQVLDTLNQIQTNTDSAAQTEALIKGDTADIKNKLDILQNTVQSGFVMTGQGLFALLEQQKTTNSLLLSQLEQDKTINCWLSTIAELLCRILRKTNTEIELQTAIKESVQMVEGIAELVHSRETLEITKLRAVESKVDTCCPPTPPRPEPCYEACKTVEVPIHEPKGGDFQPPRTNDPKPKDGQPKPPG